jgi:hypothetical protein
MICENSEMFIKIIHIVKIVRKLLIKYNYPPNKSEQAVQTVIRQAELNCKNMVE